MKNYEVGMNLTGKSYDDLVKNDCPIKLEIFASIRGCDNNCALCWNQNFNGMLKDVMGEEEYAVIKSADHPCAGCDGPCTGCQYS